jgi:hypothetical protein
LRADANRDGSVDPADYVLWRKAASVGAAAATLAAPDEADPPSATIDIALDQAEALDRATLLVIDAIASDRDSTSNGESTNDNCYDAGSGHLGSVDAFFASLDYAL